ncbi:MAG: hypothetical protein Q8O76_14725 [Chloroflexota bacterium]|nr:hypothetical protein [Chloroflexota bacterium]
MTKPGAAQEKRQRAIEETRQAAIAAADHALIEDITLTKRLLAEAMSAALRECDVSMDEAWATHTETLARIEKEVKPCL